MVGIIYFVGLCSSYDDALASTGWQCAGRIGYRFLVDANSRRLLGRRRQQLNTAWHHMARGSWLCGALCRSEWLVVLYYHSSIEPRTTVRRVGFLLFSIRVG